MSWGCPQIIPVTHDHDLVLKPMATCGTPMFRKASYDDDKSRALGFKLRERGVFGSQLPS